MTKFAFAGDRRIAVEVLQFLVDSGAKPVLLLVSDPDRATHGDELRELSALPPDKTLVGAAFRASIGVEALRRADLDYLIAVHFPYIMPAEVLAIPKVGVLNLHPAYLPYNRGWHTTSWALLDGTPIGATLHFMDTGVDTGDVVAQKEMTIRPEDTADSLYRRVLELEMMLFKESWPFVKSLAPPRVAQTGRGSMHKASDLLSPSVQRLDLDSRYPLRDVFRRLRALTTNHVAEAAYFEVDGVKYRVQISITPEHD